MVVSMHITRHKIKNAATIYFSIYQHRVVNIHIFILATVIILSILFLALYM